MITLKKLTWDNVFSYGDSNKLSLDNANVTQLIGTNGAGKSSIPLIIEEVLFNKNSKGIKKSDIANRVTKKPYNIELQFTHNEDDYTVTVSRNKSSKVILTKNGEDISSHTATNTLKTLENILGLSFNTFSQLVYQNPNTSLEFLTATDTSRKKFLVDLFGLESYLRFHDDFKSLVADYHIKEKEVQAQLDTVQKWLISNEDKDLECQELEEIDPSIGVDIDQTEKYKRETFADLSTIQETNNKIAKNNQVRKELSELDLTSLEPPLSPKNYDDLQEKVGDLKSQIEAGKKTLSSIKNLSDKCPTCGQSIDNTENIRLRNAADEKVTEAESKLLREVMPELAKIKKHNKDYEVQQLLKNRHKQLTGQLNTDLPKTLLDKSDLESKFQNCENRLRTLHKKLSEIQEANTRRVQHNARVKVLKEQIEEYKKELTSLNTELTKILEYKADLEILKKAFSTNGLLAYKIENMVNDLENITNEYLAELSDGRFLIEFVVSKDKLNVVLTDTGKAIEIAALSSGELARVNTATLLAIRKLMSSISKSKINVLFLDETINTLDEYGKEKLVEVLLNEQELNTYIVSHGWEHPLLAKVQVTKEVGISRLEK